MTRKTTTMKRMTLALSSATLRLAPSPSQLRTLWCQPHLTKTVRWPPMTVLQETMVMRVIQAVQVHHSKIQPLALAAIRNSSTKGLTAASLAHLTRDMVKATASSTIGITIAIGAKEAATTIVAITTMAKIVAMGADSPLTAIETMATEMAAMATTVIEATIIIAGTIIVNSNRITTSSTKTKSTPSRTIACTTKMIQASSARRLTRKRKVHSNSRFTSSSRRTMKVTSRPRSSMSARKKSRCRSSCKALALKALICNLFSIVRDAAMTN